MIRPGTHGTKGLLRQLRDQEGSLLVEVVPMASLLATSGPADPLILVKLVTLVRRSLILCHLAP